MKFSKLDYLTFVFIFLYTTAALSVSLNRYWQFQTYYFDFGIFDSALWKVAHFQLPVVDHINFGNTEKLIFADHFNPSVFLLAPLYWITDRREIILIAQTLIVSASAVAGFFLAKIQLKNSLIILTLVISYLGYVGLQNALISDFHEATVLTLPLMLAFLFIYLKKWKLFLLMLLIILGFKESFAGLGIGIGIFLLIRNFKENQIIGLLTILLSLIWGVVAINYIIPYFSQGAYFFTPDNLPSNIPDLVNKFLFPDSKHQAIFYTFLTFGFLPLTDLATLPAIFEIFFERFVLSSYKGYDLGLHYNAPLAPLMFVGAVYGFLVLIRNKFIKKWIWMYCLLIILTVFYLHRVQLHGPLGLAYNPVFYEQSNGVKYVEKFLAGIPKEGVVMSHNDLLVRLTHRDFKLLRMDYKKISPDYIAINLTPGQNPNSFFPLNFDQVKSLKDELILDKEYRLKKFGDEVYLFTKVNN